MAISRDRTQERRSGLVAVLTLCLVGLGLVALWLTLDSDSLVAWFTLTGLLVYTARVYTVATRLRR